MPSQKGAGWGYDGNAISGGSLAPMSVRSVTDDCAFPERVAPVQTGGRYQQSLQTGGHYSRRYQQGGACGCNMLQGGRRQRGGRYSRRYSRRQHGGGCGACMAMQTGGGCGACMQLGGGGGGGGYSVMPSDNMLGKVAVIQPGACMKGGDASPIVESVHTAGYDNTRAYLSDNAHFTLVDPYQAKGGRSRSKRNRSKRARQSRRR